MKKLEIKLLLEIHLLVDYLLINQKKKMSTKMALIYHYKIEKTMVKTEIVFTEDIKGDRSELKRVKLKTEKGNCA